MNVEAELIKEIGKWSKKLDDSLLDIHALDNHGAKMLENIHAYCKDSKHFSENRDLVKSFECLIWAWALLELGKELKHLGSLNRTKCKNTTITRVRTPPC